MLSISQYYNKVYKQHEMVPLMGISRSVLIHRMWVGADPALFFTIVANQNKVLGQRAQLQLQFDHAKFDKEIKLGYYRSDNPNIWYFDYLYGCALKTTISETHILRSKYDDYHGEGKLVAIMQSILDENRKTVK